MAITTAPTTTLRFAEDINISAQAGDIIYFCKTESKAEFNVSKHDTKLLGKIVKIYKNLTTNIWEIICEYNPNTSLPTTDDFIMFGKDTSVNVSSLLGYYAEVKFVNDSEERGELFATACNIFTSSK